jgi:hypothetical protein
VREGGCAVTQPSLPARAPSLSLRPPPPQLVSGLDAVGKYVQILEYNVTTTAAPNGASRNMVVVLSVNFDFAQGGARPPQPVSCLFERTHATCSTIPVLAVC